MTSCAKLRLILPRFVVNGQCDLLRPRCRPGNGSAGLKLAGWLRIEHVVAVADIDLGLLPRNLEVVVSFLEHSPESHVRRVAMPCHN